MKIVCLGDSITFGFGAPRFSRFTALVQKETGWDVVNAGINGDTTAGMLARLDRDVLRRAPDVLMLLGGANDLMNSCPEGTVRGNVTAIIQQAQRARIKTMLGTILPMYRAHMPAEWAPSDPFRAPESVYEAHRCWQKVFAAAFDTVLVDFYGRLKPLADANPEAYFCDGLHPTALGHRVMADMLTEAVRGMR